MEVSAQAKGDASEQLKRKGELEVHTPCCTNGSRH